MAVKNSPFIGKFYLHTGIF